MPETVNRIRNVTFARGREHPTSWEWSASGDASFKRPSAGRTDRAAGGVGVGVIVESRTATDFASFAQDVRCKPQTHYRIEAVVSCALTSDDGGGCILSAQAIRDGDAALEVWNTPPLLRTAGATTIRTIFKSPDDVRRIRVAVAVDRARGSVHIHEVRFIGILEPDADSHAIALPPPPYRLRAPRVVRNVAICSATSKDRPLTHLLAEFFGSAKVRHVDASTGEKALSGTDGLLLPDPTPPRFVRSVSALLKLAAERVVVISLPAFATLTRGRTPIKRIEQTDDPIHAKILYGNFATHGFALHDIFPYAWNGKQPGSFVQNQFRKSKEFAAFCVKNKLTPLLASMCDRDATSERPIALYRETPQGCLFVLDVDPVEAPCSALGETNLAIHLLLAVLGRQVSQLGQYICPYELNGTFRSAIREMSVRFAGLNVLDPDVPAEEVAEQMVIIGGADESFGLPLMPKPAIILRTGLTSGDVESVYGALLWLKQLVRMEPHRCPYADALSSAFRIAWIPCVAPWEYRPGWEPSATPPSNPTEIDSEHSQVAAIIDVVSRPVARTRVVTATSTQFYERASTWLPQLTKTFGPGRGLTFAPPVNTAFADRSNYAWQSVRSSVDVVVDPSVFEEPAHGQVADGGGEVIRIEIPGGGSDFSGYSIQRSDAAATLIEHVLGLLLGLIAVNRTRQPISFDGFPPLASGDALIVRDDDPMLRAEKVHVS